MLPGLGFSEILVVGVIALLVVGPKDLPIMLRKLGQFTRRMQAMAAEFRQGFDELARQAELDELRKEVEAMRRTVSVPDLETALAGPPPPPVEAPPDIPEEMPQRSPEEIPPDAIPIEEPQVAPQEIPPDEIPPESPPPPPDGPQPTRASS